MIQGTYSSLLLFNQRRDEKGNQIISRQRKCSVVEYY